MRESYVGLRASLTRANAGWQRAYGRGMLSVCDVQQP